MGITSYIGIYHSNGRFMKKLSVQYLLKMTPELMALIDNAFSTHLKKTGEYITKAEYIRKILEKQCSSTLGDQNNNGSIR